MAYAEEHIPERHNILCQVFYAKRNSARKVTLDMPTNVWPKYWMFVGPTSCQRYMSNMSYVGTIMRQHVGAMLRQHVGPTMLGQRSLSMFGQRSGQPKYSFGPTLSCYLGRAEITVFFFIALPALWLSRENLRQNHTISGMFFGQYFKIHK